MGIFEYIFLPTVVGLRTAAPYHTPSSTKASNADWWHRSSLQSVAALTEKQK